METIYISVNHKDKIHLFEELEVPSEDVEFWISKLQDGINLAITDIQLLINGIKEI